MRVVPERSPWLQIVAAFGGFMIGPFAALGVSMALVPESGLVQSASVFAFALIFVGGSLIWLGLGIAAVVLSFFWNVVRGRRPGPESLGPSDRLVPPGYKAYVAFGLAIGMAVGLLAGLATPLSVMTATATWTSMGLAYGTLLWAAAHHGYLPFDPE